MSVATDIDFCDSLRELVKLHAEWSQKTFGPDTERGPIGPLKHLSKEALEAAAQPTDISEYADCFLLLLDATRRGGWKLGHIIDAAQKKLEICKQREWGPVKPDEPVYHTPEAPQDKQLKEQIAQFRNDLHVYRNCEIEDIRVSSDEFHEHEDLADEMAESIESIVQYAERVTLLLEAQQKLNS